MGNSSGNITAPVSVTDVKTVLGLSDNSLSALCTSGQINMWAKHAPIQYDTSSALTDAQRNSVNHRFDIPYVSNPTQIMAYVGSGLTWGRPKPSSKYRLGDFSGYRHSAGCPFLYGVSPASATSGSTITVGYNIGSGIVASPDLQLSDFSGTVGGYTFSDFNAGVAWRIRGSSDTPYAMTFGASTTTELPKNTLSLGNTYDLVFFFTNLSFSATQTSYSGIYVPAPYPSTIMTYANGRPQVTYTYSINKWCDTITVTAKSDSGGNQTFTLLLMFSDYNGTRYYYKFNSGGSVTVTPDGITETFTVQSGDNWMEDHHYMSIYTNGGWYETPMQFRRQSTPSLG